MFVGSVCFVNEMQKENASTRPSLYVLRKNIRHLKVFCSVTQESKDIAADVRNSLISLT